MPKARATPLGAMACIPLMKSGLHGITSQSAQKVPCEKIELLRSCVSLRRQLSLRLLEACAAMVDSERDELRFALAALNWYHSHAC